MTRTACRCTFSSAMSRQSCGVGCGTITSTCGLCITAREKTPCLTIFILCCGKCPFAFRTNIFCLPFSRLCSSFTRLLFPIAPIRCRLDIEVSLCRDLVEKVPILKACCNGESLVALAEKLDAKIYLPGMLWLSHREGESKYHS